VWRRIIRSLVVVAVVLVVGLAATGVDLSLHYFPGIGDDPVRELHRLLGQLLLLSTMGLLVATIGLTVEQRRWTEAAMGGLALLLAVAASLTGELLPWDQLALDAVVVGSDLDLDGVWRPAFDEGVRFVLVDGAEVPPSDYAQSAIAHTIVLPLLLVGVLAAIGWRRRRISRSDGGCSGSELGPHRTAPAGGAPGPPAATPASTTSGSRPDRPTG
jgi:hypothetical protein